jgi:hypothetical protein
MTVHEFSLRAAELSAVLGNAASHMSAWWLLAPVVLVAWAISQ